MDIAPLQVSKYRCSLASLAKHYGTPLFVFFEGQIRNTARLIIAHCNQGRQPIALYFSCKANSNHHILRIIREEGLGIEVSSPYELAKALAAGYGTSQIIYGGPAKTPETFVMLAEKGPVRAIIADSTLDLAHIVELIEKEGWNPPPNLWIRMNLNCSKQRFGILQSTLLDWIKCHRGSCIIPYIQGLQVHPIALGGLRKMRERILWLLSLREKLMKEGVRISVLDLGGGFPFKYLRNIRDAECILDEDTRQEYCGLNVSNYLQIIEDSFSTVLKRDDILEVVLEPGRSVIACAAALLTTILDVKSDHRYPWVILDAGVNHLVEASDYWYFEIQHVWPKRNNRMAEFRLGGPTCSMNDVFHDAGTGGTLPETRLLPSDLAVGDILAFLDVGAYSLDQQTQLCCVPDASAVLISDEKTKLIRQRNRLGDLLEKEDFEGASDEEL